MDRENSHPVCDQAVREGAGEVEDRMGGIGDVAGHSDSTTWSREVKRLESM
jgi:hypothetical protein